MPSAAPAASTFAGIDTVVLTRNTAEITTPLMNEIESEGSQGVYMIPKASGAGITYNDWFYYNAAGQLWLWGGYSNTGAGCGLSAAYSNLGWAHSNAFVSARLDFHGSVNKVTGGKLLELLS